MLLDQISVTLINYTMKIVMDTIGIGRCCCSKFDIEIERDRRPKEVNRFFIDSMLLFFLQFFFLFRSRSPFNFLVCVSLSSSSVFGIRVWTLEWETKLASQCCSRGSHKIYISGLFLAPVRRENVVYLFSLSDHDSQSAATCFRIRPRPQQQRHSINHHSSWFELKRDTAGARNKLAMLLWCTLHTHFILLILKALNLDRLQLQLH